MNCLLIVNLIGNYGSRLFCVQQVKPKTQNKVSKETLFFYKQVIVYSATQSLIASEQSLSDFKNGDKTEFIHMGKLCFCDLATKLTYFFMRGLIENKLFDFPLEQGLGFKFCMIGALILCYNDNMFDNYIAPVVYGGGALALLGLFLFGLALPSFLKGKFTYLLSLLGLVLVAFPFLAIETSMMIEVCSLLLGLIMVGWGLPFKGRRGLTIFWAFLALIVGVAAVAFAIIYGVINRH